MNFFEAQDKAHKRTGMLVGALGIGLIGMTVGLYFITMLAVQIAGMYEQAQDRDAAQRGESTRPSEIKQWLEGEVGSWWDFDLALVTFGIMIVLVGGGFLFRYLQLRSGGEVVAEMLGGVRIEPDTSNPDERRALNVVEEMAIASGIPVPPVFAIPSDSINAFAAGHTVDQAAIGLTKGCIEMPRDELQGVVAHEFSHIFNGDMRLNLRLVAVINGVMVLGIAGLFLIRVVAYSMLFGGGGRSGKDKNGMAIALAIIVFGALVAAVGFLGTLMARLIQAAISRQREYLADASAVQFTRNADGIAGALRRISGSTKKAKFAAEASQFNHMFFSQAMNAAFATHPPLTDRIKRIAGSTTGPDMNTAPREAVAAPGATASMQPEVSRAGLGIAAGAVAIAGMRNSIAHAGEIGAISMDWTRSILESIPDELRIAARTPRSARALIAAMLMDEGGTDDEALASQRAAMQRLLPTAEVQNAEILRPLLQKLQPAARVPLLDLTSPAMQALSPTQAAELQQLVEALVAADKHVSRFEWIVAILVDAMLDRSGKASHRTAGTIKSIVPAVRSILSVTATAGTDNRDEAIAAVATACQGLGIQPPERGLESVSIKSINAAVHDLRTLAFAERKRLLEAVVDVVAHDEKTTVDEAEMVRVVSEVLAVPMPPVQPDVLAA
ncbi:MAG: M48 family metallopeptidase [Phycisphaerales bacterium]|nr:M48 family metallopeptidase [Phycisphaerales bacterium]